MIGEGHTERNDEGHYTLSDTGRKMFEFLAEEVEAGRERTAGAKSDLSGGQGLDL